MNYLQFGLFFVYLFSLLIAGIGIYQWLNPTNDKYMNRHVYAGETLLLGSILLIGELFSLSLVGLYRAPFLWGAVILNCAFLFRRDARERFLGLLKERVDLDVPLFLFLMLMAVYIFRNMYFLVDVDSQSVYLFAQKLWLIHKTSIVGDPATNIYIFAPQFNTVPYALGLSLFPADTLFPQLIVVSWMLIAFLLVFGYTAYRFNRYYGLGAVMLVLFNDHIFYSGANSCCIINGAVISLLWVAAYNFWESRRQNSLFRLLLGLVFLSQLLANKLQMAYVLVLFLGIAALIQKNLMKNIRDILRNKRFFIVLLTAIAFFLLWPLKNYLATGLATFPAMAGKFRIFGWTPEMAAESYNVFRGSLSFPKFLKYASYLFVWPGVNPAKYVWIIIFFSPVLLMITARRRPIDQEATFEFGYWLGLSIIMIMGLCLLIFFDPRNFRFGIGIFSFAAIFGVDYIFRQCFGVTKRLFAGLMVLALALPGYSIMWSQGGSYKRPTLEDNLGVLSNRLHFSDVVGRYYPKNRIAEEGFKADPAKAMKGAWDIGVAGVTPLSAFLLPVRPQVGLWNTSIVKWDSYDHPESIVKDLKEFGIEWVMRVKGDNLIFLSSEEYAREAVHYERYPKSIYYNYNFPQELSEIHRYSDTRKPCP